jgi:hypothetical protein
MCALRGAKTGDSTRHIKFPEDLELKLMLLAEYEHRPFTEMVIKVVDEALNGPRIVRLMAEGRSGK